MAASNGRKTSSSNKKTTRSTGGGKSSSQRRGYENGSHSEIEVSKEKNWTGRKIYNRSKRLLQFMEQRWKFKLTKEQMDRLIYIKFVMDNRKVPDELPKGSS